MHRPGCEGGLPEPTRGCGRHRMRGGGRDGRGERRRAGHRRDILGNSMGRKQMGSHPVGTVRRDGTGERGKTYKFALAGETPVDVHGDGGDEEDVGGGAGTWTRKKLDEAGRAVAPFLYIQLPFRAHPRSMSSDQWPPK